MQILYLSTMSHRRQQWPSHTRFLFIMFVFYWSHSTTAVQSLSSGQDDPYTVLGVSRGVSPQEIRSVYKQLAREWHPDKNKDPNAQSRFVQINKAYELLSDPDRRKLYDQRGIQEEDYSDRRDYSSFTNHFDPLDDVLSFATGGSFHFPFSDGMSFLHKQSVTSKTFDQTVLPKSNTVPQLIIFYQDWCMTCARAAPAWRTVTDELQAIGMDVFSVHGERERGVARRMGVSAVPAVVLVIEGHPFHYQDTVITPSKVLGFVRSHIPSDVIDEIDDGNVQSFLISWTDNRVRVLIFGMGTSVKLRYSLLAFQYRERAAFGYVMPSESSLRSRFGVQRAVDSVMVFKETAKPAASLAMADIPYNLLRDLLENNKFLILPRLSSQVVMDAICPTESSVYRRRLCVLLIENESSDQVRNSLREFAMNWGQARVRFAHVFPERQRDFFNSLVYDGHKRENQNLVILWRQDVTRGAYEWMEWDGSNASSQKLETTLSKLLNEKKPLAHLVELKELTDEHAKSFFSKVLRKLSHTVDFFRTHLTRDTVIQAASLIATVLFVVAGGFIMAYLVRLEEESIAAKARATAENRPPRDPTNQTNNATTRPTNQSASSSNGSRNPGTGANKYNNNTELKVHEMRGETYNGLVKLIKPGCRTIILLLDAETKASLLPKFQRGVWPYRKNKSLQFGFMHVDKGGGLTWYKELLLLSLTEPRNLNINPRNCVGTVLSLNGYRRYFCVFHATLPGGAIKRQRYSTGGYRNGGFLGFDSDQDSDGENSDVENWRPELPADPPHPPNILFTSHLLDNLSNWLDRLFEGTTHRYHINYWPDFPVK